MNGTKHKRRNLMMRRALFLKGLLDGISQPLIKWAETTDELEQAFRLVYDEYLRLGYIQEPNPSHIYFNIYNLLPTSATLVMKCGETVISTLSRVRDDEHFGLPMNSIYREELDGLRDQGRRLCEFCSLANTGKFRHRNLFMYLFRSMYLNAIETGVNDICIMVNPRHVDFYKAILFFEDLGPEKTYPRLGQPAVALRLNLDVSGQKLKEAYKDCEPNASLYNFVYGSPKSQLEGRDSLLCSKKRSRLTAPIVQYFLTKEKNLMKKLLPVHKTYMLEKYPGLGFTDLALEI
jgi:hypothetical protein